MNLTDQEFHHHSQKELSNIVGLRPALTGVYVTIHCPTCSNNFESYQPTVAGVTFGQHTCSQCNAIYEVWPDEFESALDCYLPVSSPDEIIAHTEIASDVAETWYTVEPLASLLTYKGINMGESTERELLSFITLGLHLAEANRERD